MAKRCAIEIAGGGFPKNAVENPQSLDLCKAHYVAQGHVQTAKVDCMVIGCVGKAGITGLCKRHTTILPAYWTKRSREVLALPRRRFRNKGRAL